MTKLLLLIALTLTGCLEPKEAPIVCDYKMDKLLKIMRPLDNVYEYKDALKALFNSTIPVIHRKGEYEYTATYYFSQPTCYWYTVEVYWKGGVGSIKGKSIEPRKW